jgi:flagellar P-ring protein precursor FlgI
MPRSHGTIPGASPLALALGALVVAAGAAGAAPVRVKDLVSIEGADPVELYGYGLVIGLNGTGDGRTISYTRQSLLNLMERMGLTVEDEHLRAKNVASVMVAATIGPWDAPGSLVDVNVSSVGDATSLAGGFLLLTELRGPDENLYATAQGALSVGGFDFRSFEGARVRRNYVTAGRVPEGGRIVAGVPFQTPTGPFHLFLDQPDFAAADRIAGALAARWGAGSARAVDAGRVQVDVALLPQSDFAKAMAELDAVAVEPVATARLVINERTGTLVAGGDVRLLPAAVSHGNLNVRIDATAYASQPAPFSETGQTAIVRNTEVRAAEAEGGVVALPATTTADQLAVALNALGVSPRDLIAIFQALKAAGALPAKMEIL